jgi:4'-phosphopantetheinyl transferase EntD
MCFAYFIFDNRYPPRRTCNVTSKISTLALFYQHNINQTTRLAIWRIEEPESFFLERVPLKRDVTHPYKRLQHLAGRYLLPILFKDFPLEEILVADTRKPYLPGEKYHFSISHAGNFAAAIASSDKRVGIDVELVSSRIEKISHKFLSPGEKDFLHQWDLFEKLKLELITVLWSSKEAMFKWYGNGEVDFREHMQLNGPIKFAANEWILLPFLFSKQVSIPVQLHARIFEPLVLSYVVT